MGRSDDMADWLIRLEKDKTILLSSRRKLKSNIIIYISLNSTLQCNLIENPLFIKSWVCRGIYGGHHKNTCPLEGGSEIKILKANGRAKEKGMCLKEQQIYQSNCLELSRKHSVPSCPCLLVPCCAFSCLVMSSRALLCLLVSSRVLLCLFVSSRATVL